MSLKPCPYCQAQPDFGRCEPWPKCESPAPYYIGCYQSGDDEHFVGGNADTLAGLRAVWDEAIREAMTKGLRHE